MHTQSMARAWYTINVIPVTMIFVLTGEIEGIINLLLNISCWTQKSPPMKVSLGARWKERMYSPAD